MLQRKSSLYLRRVNKACPQTLRSKPVGSPPPGRSGFSETCDRARQRWDRAFEGLYLLSTDEDDVLFCGDLIHVPAAQFSRPELT
jgi:hypothetical protein